MPLKLSNPAKISQYFTKLSETTKKIAICKPLTAAVAKTKGKRQMSTRTKPKIFSFILEAVKSQDPLRQSTYFAAG
uniref:Uncharacterized protein n=1 Tax=Arundo donax TaxID=35708 RepID=A0A0A9TX65_ARUDO